MSEQKNSYASVGVDIAAGQRAMELMKTAVRATYTADVLSETGNFGGLFAAAALKQMDSPVLVASTDGVGTKTMVAATMNRWDTIGHDIVNHCANDILVQGAKPLFFLDYVASAKLQPEQIATVVRGIAYACQALGCALLGGETAEMPGVYQQGELDLVGTIVGIVEHGKLVDGSRISAGDAVLAFPSSGLHTNGFTLARHALRELDWHVPNPRLGGQTVGETLLTPHRAYVNEVNALWQAGIDIRGLAHITGGGLIDNPPRIFPAGLGAALWQDGWEVSPIFQLIQQLGDIEQNEMFHVFNMGLGMLIIVPEHEVANAQTAVSELLHIGRIHAGSGVQIVNRQS